MAQTHEQFTQSLKEQTKNGTVNEFQEDKQRIKNKYDNWVLKRKKEGKDSSMERFQKLQEYFKREQQKFHEILNRRNQESLKRYNSGHSYMADDEIMYYVKQDLYKWRDNDREYQEMREEIEELRYVSDNPVQSLSNGSR